MEEGKYCFGLVKVGDKGQIVIPKDVRKKYDIKPGDSLMLLGDNNGIAAVKAELFNKLISKALEGMNNTDIQ